MWFVDVVCGGEVSMSGKMLEKDGVVDVEGVKVRVCVCVEMFKDEELVLKV